MYTQRGSRASLPRGAPLDCEEPYRVISVFDGSLKVRVPSTGMELRASDKSDSRLSTLVTVRHTNICF